MANKMKHHWFRLSEEQYTAVRAIFDRVDVPGRRYPLARAVRECPSMSVSGETHFATGAEIEKEWFDGFVEGIMHGIDYERADAEIRAGEEIIESIENRIAILTANYIPFNFYSGKIHLYEKARGVETLRRVCAKNIKINRMRSNHFRKEWRDVNSKNLCGNCIRYCAHRDVRELLDIWQGRPE